MFEPLQLPNLPDHESLDLHEYGEDELYDRIEAANKLMTVMDVFDTDLGSNVEAFNDLELDTDLQTELFETVGLASMQGELDDTLSANIFLCLQCKDRITDAIDWLQEYVRYAEDAIDEMASDAKYGTYRQQVAQQYETSIL